MKPLIPHKAYSIVLLVTTLSFPLLSIGQTFATLWAEYVANPYNHANIPNNSYAGYGTGIVSIPSPAYTVYNVTSAPYNAIPNDAIDDQPAIQAAIDAAGVAGSGIVFIPAGTYYLNKPLYIKYNNVIVRGNASSGASATILDFRFSMYSMFTADINAGAVGPGGLWWATGLVWIGPANTFLVNGAPNMITDYEHWRTSATLATVTVVANPGDFTMTVNSTASLSVGTKLLLRYVMPSDRSLIKEIHGHTATKPGIDNDANVGDCTNIKSPGEQYYFYPITIQSIVGNVITLDRPLRIRVDPAVWVATIQSINGLVTESGVESLQILGHNIASMAHLPAPTSTATSGNQTQGGWNGVYINRSWNCWANDIRLVNLECGVIFSAAKNSTANNIFVTSTGTTRWYHHPFALRVYSSDNLVQNFTVDGPSRVYHGINAEWYSSGNVYSKGLMKVGTFDSHRGSAFDQIRTEITVANDAGSAPGGAGTSGPFAGKRFAHWNIIQQIQGGYTYQNGASRNGNDVNEPRQFPMGVLVAITGALDGSDGEFVPPGDLGARNAPAVITNPALINLYEAELQLRISTTLPIHLINFTVTRNNDKAKATWTVSEPENTDRFILQWSTDGRQFNDINNQPANEHTLHYQFEHMVSSWQVTNYYRLKIINGLGATIYSPIRRLTPANGTEQSIDLYPNPVTDIVSLSLNNYKDGEIKSVRILNNSGQLVKWIRSSALINTHQMDIDVRVLSPGQYFIEVYSQSGITRKIFIKN